MRGRHTFKAGGEWMHTLNDQVFRGFFTGRYLFDSVTGFLRYASPAAAGGFGPADGRLFERGLRHLRRRRARPGRRPPADRCCFYLQGAGRTGLATDAAGASNDRPTRSCRCSSRTSGRLRPNLTINYGLRWDAQVMPETVDPADDRVRRVPERSDVPVGRHDPESVEDVPAARRRRVGRPAATASRWCALSAGIYSARQNMLSQVGSVTTNGLQQQSIFASTENLTGSSARRRRCGRACSRPPPLPAGSSRSSAACASSTRDYANPRIYSLNVAYEQEFRPNWSGYVDFIWAKGTNLTRFLNYNRSGPAVLRRRPGHRQRLRLHAASPGARSSTR